MTHSYDGLTVLSDTCRLRRNHEADGLYSQRFYAEFLPAVKAPEVAKAMQPFPQLSPEALKALEIIVSYNTIDGSTLMKYMEMTSPSDVAKPIKELQKLDLIEVGGTMSADALPFARFGIRPSAKEYLNSLLKRMA